jgi:hypothetical protein
VKSDLTDFQGLFLRACKEQALEEAAKRASEEGTFFRWRESCALGAGVNWKKMALTETEAQIQIISMSKM